MSGFNFWFDAFHVDSKQLTDHRHVFDDETGACRCGATLTSFDPLAAHIHCITPEEEADAIKRQVREEKRAVNSLTWPSIERTVAEHRLCAAMAVPSVTPTARLGMR